MDQFSKSLEEAAKKQELMDRIKNLGPEQQKLFFDLGLSGMGSIEPLGESLLSKMNPNQVLEFINTPEKVGNLSVQDQKIYKNALNDVFGSVEKRAELSGKNLKRIKERAETEKFISEQGVKIDTEQKDYGSIYRYMHDGDNEIGTILFNKDGRINADLDPMLRRKGVYQKLIEDNAIATGETKSLHNQRNALSNRTWNKLVDKDIANRYKSLGHDTVWGDEIKNQLNRSPEANFDPRFKDFEGQHLADGGIVQDQLINVRDPDTGEIGSLPASQLAEASQFGYTPATPQETESFVREQKFGTPLEQAKTGLEGALSAATFGLSTAIETGLGAKPEDIVARRETNPLAHGAGQAAGLIGSSFLIPGGGVAGAMEEAGALAAGKLAPATYDAAKALNAAREAGVGIEEAQSAYKAAKAAEPFLIKVGSEAANQSVQFALMQAGDEVSRSFVEPKRSFADAMADVGLSGIIGGATGGVIGSVNPLWEATLGKKLEPWLEKFKARANGETIPIGNDLETVLKNEPAEVRAAFIGPEQEAYFKELVESGTSKGEALRLARDKTLEKMESNIYDIVTPKEKLSAFEAGEKAKEAILNKLEEFNQRVKAGYDEIGDIAQVSISDEPRLKFYDDLMAHAVETYGTDSPIYAMSKNWAERVLAKDTIGGMDQLVTELGGQANKAYRSGDFVERKALSDIREQIKMFQENYLDKQALDLAKATGDENVLVAALLAKEQRSYARELYKDFIGKISDIASVGKIKAKSWGQLQDALENVPSARFADKLFDRKNIEGLRLLRDEHPDVFNAIIDQKKSEFAELTPRKLINKIDALPKEVRNIMFSEQEQKLIANSEEVINKLNKRINPSGTARTLDTLWNKLPAGVGLLSSFLTGGNPVVGMLAGEGVAYLGRDIPDAIKLGMLKYLGAQGPVDASIFKSMVDYAEIVQAGQAKLAKSAKQVFMPMVTEAISQPSQKDRDKLQRQLVDIQNDPHKMIEVGGKLQQGMPDHTSVMAQYSMGAVNYLNSIRPKTTKAMPLDKNPQVSEYDKAKYNRALDIAEKPLIVFDSVKNGTVTQHDVNVLKNVNMPLYNKMSESILTNLVDHTEKGKDVPYKTRLGIATFLEQPIDSTMTPQAIAATQNLVAPEQAQGQTIPGQRAKHSFTALNKMPGMYQTPQQARTSNKLAP